MSRKRNEGTSVPLSDGGSMAPAKRRRTTARPKSEVASAEAPVPTIAVSAEPTVNPASAVEARAVSTATATAELEPSTNGQGAAFEDEQEEIARLAYSYWEARGRQGGSPEEDWQRAAEEVRRRRGF